MSKEYVFTARVEEGRLKVGLRVLEAMRLALQHWQRCPVTITVEKQHATRSVDQNALYWAGYVNPLADYTGYTPLEMHAYLKKRFLPKQRIEIVDKRSGVVVDEQDLEQLTTTTLNKIEFGEYLDEIKAFALDLGVIVGSNREHVA
jgi:hypothetical protein